MRLTVILGLLAVISSVAVEGSKRKKCHKHRGASHRRSSHRREQFPRSHLGRHGPFGLHGSHDPPPRRFRPTHDYFRRPWLDSFESSEASSGYNRGIDNDNSWELSSEENWRSRPRPCSSRRCPPRKLPCQRNTTPLPIQTSPTNPTTTTPHRWAENIPPKPSAGYWETILSWPTTRPTTRETREPVTNPDINVTTTVRPEGITIPQHIIDCVGNCTTTSEFHPVCGTDGVTYDNIGRLFCAKTCGINVEFRRASVCPPPPFPDYEYVDENGSGDAPGGGDENRSGDYGDSDISPPPTPSPTPPTTINPRFLFQTTLLTKFQQCMKICPITLHYNPVCGTDLVTYFNVNRMICARECGQDVEVLCEKPCSVCSWRTTSTTTSTTPRTLPQTTTTYRTAAQSTTKVNDARTTRASKELCFKACAITSEHNPVCGTNNVNYTNPAHLLCAQMCGEEVKVARFAPCPSATESPKTTTEEDYDDYTLPPHILACTSTCPTTPEYNPVCGTNGGTYFNIGRLECDKYCGVDVQMSYKGLCLGFLPPFLTSLGALAKITTPIWKTSTFSTPTTSYTPLKLSIPQSQSTPTASSITLKTPITSSWNTPITPPTISKIPITSPWNTLKTSSTILDTPITSSWNTPIMSSTISNVPKTSSWSTPTTPSTLTVSITTTSSTALPDTESTIPSTSSKDSSATLATSSLDSPSTAPSSKTLTTSTSFATETPSSEILSTVDFTIPQYLLASIFNIPTREDTSTQPNIMTTVAEENFSFDPRFGLVENAKRNNDDTYSNIVFPDNR